MQISHTVFRGRNNLIALELLEDDAALPDPGQIVKVEVSIGALVLDTEQDEDEIQYSAGTLTMRLGLIEAVKALEDGVYLAEVTGFQDTDEDGTAFGNFQIYLRNWGGEGNVS